MSRSRKHAALGEFLEWESQSCVEVVVDIEIDERASFMPLASLKTYFEADDCQRIDKILCEVFATKYPPVDSEFILREHIAIFCILLRIGQGTLIEHFARYEELSDRRLPFDPDHPPVGFPSPDDDPTFAQRFCEKQRTYCVPIFDTHMLHKHFGSQRLLPIISKQARDDGEPSNEYIIEVYGPHNKMLPRGKITSNSNANKFLLKRYSTKDGESQYTQIINGFRSVKQADNIIKFYGSYIYGDNYNVLLEFADKGSLEDYFKREAPPSRGGDIIKFWEALFQLIKGLKAIHSARDGHFDVRPENVLVVSNGAEVSDWLFKFADFGSSAVKSKDRSSKTAAMKDTPIYEAPECNVSASSSDQSSGTSTKITWSADIWSLGCIYSEAAMWIADGYKGVTDYRKQRLIDTDGTPSRRGGCFHDGEQVLQSVVDTHREIEDRLRRSDYITQDVLDSMVEEMLWEEDRPNAKALWRKAEGVMSRAHQRLAAASGDEVSRNSSGKSRSLPPLRSQPPTKPLPVPPRPPPGLSSIAERQYVDNVEKWRSQVTTSVVSSSQLSRQPSQLSRAPSDVSSPPLPHSHLSRAGTVTSDLDREINGSTASWQLVDSNSSTSPTTPMTSPHVSSLYDGSMEETQPVRHRILRPHQPVESRRPPQAGSHLSNNQRHTGNFGNAYIVAPQSDPQLPQRNPSRNNTLEGGFVPISAPKTPPIDVPINTGLFPPSPAPQPQKKDAARIFSQEIKSTFRTEADWDVGAAIVDPRTTTVSEKRTSLGRIPSRAPSRAGSQNSSSVYSGPTSPSVQPDSVSFTTMIQEEAPKPSHKPSKRSFAFSIFPTKLRNDSTTVLETSRPSTNHDSIPPPYSSSDTASTFSGSHLPSEYGPSIEYLSLNTCLEWKRASKSLSKKHKSAKLPPLPGAHRLAGLSDRDHVFILDDSASMTSVWSDVKRLFEALSYTVKGMSPNGTELFFTISYDTWRRKDTFDLCAYLEKHILAQKQQTDIAKRLNLQLETYRHRYFTEKSDAAAKIEKKKREKIAGLPPKPVRPMSFYIFTNGEWKSGSDVALRKTIQTMADWLGAEGLPEGHVSIEFVSFAGSAEGMGRLNEVGKTDFGRGMVDCTRWTGNVLKMLGGPLDRAFYAAEGGEGLEGPKVGDEGSGISEMAA